MTREWGGVVFVSTPLSTGRHMSTDSLSSQQSARKMLPLNEENHLHNLTLED